MCTRCSSYSSTTTTFLSSVKKTKKNSGIIVTNIARRRNSSFSSSSFKRLGGLEQSFTNSYLGFVVGVGKKKTTNKAPAFSVVAAAATEETTTETAASKRKAVSAFPTMMKTMNTFLGVTNELGASLLALVALLCNCAYFSANTTTSGASGFAIVVIILMNKIALSALLVKTLAAFALPVDIQSYLAYATFPWRPREAFANKKVLITGASQGLGEAIAYYVSSFGANVVLASRNVKNLEGVGKKCLENGAKAVEVVAFDALKPESAEMLAKAASEAFNDDDEDGDSNNNKSYCCDYAFLCAGASQSASAFDVTESAERELFNLNALSTIQVLKNILPSMIARNRGHVCVISSMAAICPAPGQSSYAASKAALSKYVDSLRAEIGHTAKNVTLTNCYPGPIATGFNGKKRVVFNATGVNENHPKGLAKGRLPVETVAKMAVKLTSFGQYSIHLAPKLVMFLSRCVHFCPTVAYAVMDKLGPKRAQAAKKGESLYELKVKDA